MRCATLSTQVPVVHVHVAVQTERSMRVAPCLVAMCFEIESTFMLFFTWFLSSTPSHHTSDMWNRYQIPDISPPRVTLFIITRHQRRKYSVRGFSPHVLVSFPKRTMTMNCIISLSCKPFSREPKDISSEQRNRSLTSLNAVGDSVLFPS